MLIDEVKIKVSAGNGGTGAALFNKNMMAFGPAGGSGGRGGSVYAEGVSNLSALNQFRYKKSFDAESGQDGRGQFRDGHNGEDLILKLPIGTIIHNLTNESDEEITKVGQRILLAKGGNGGKGNFHFRSSTNTSPKQFQFGKPGQSYDFRFELKLIADIGFVGLPNVGKSSLLNELTNSKSKVANYHFTTLEPSLGVYYELILADIPGLIAGSSSGKGLGIKFLRHIERTNILFHCISSESENPAKDYKTIRDELGSYSKELLQKPEYLFLTKTDLLEEKDLKAKLKELKKINANAMALSLVEPDTMKKLREILNLIKKEKLGE